MKPLSPVHTVYVENRVAHTAMTRRVLERLGHGVDVQFTDDPAEVTARYDLRRGAHRRGKQALLLHDFRGEAIKPCPGTPEYLCCLYQILNFAVGCPLDCTYCILQDYFSNPLLTVQANPDAFLGAAAEILRSTPEQFWRLGTGEFADSLALEPLTDYAPLLVEFIRDFPNAMLELKSKAVHVDKLLDLDHQGRTVCAWSMNWEKVTEEEELKASSIEERLEAARKCEAAGYRLAFHFDPILPEPGWEAGYEKTVRRIFETVRPESIVWISLGCFRHTPGLEWTIRERFPKNRYTYGEFILGGDKKMRYPQPLRIAVYRKMMEWIRQYGGPGPVVYFCMENAQVWQAVMGRVPKNNEVLGKWLDHAFLD